MIAKATKSTRQRAIEWWNSITESYRERLINMYDNGKFISRYDNRLYNREIEEIYTKIHH
jgi:hypothetical protein